MRKVRKVKNAWSEDSIRKAKIHSFWDVIKYSIPLYVSYKYLVSHNAHFVGRHMIEKRKPKIVRQKNAH